MIIGHQKQWQFLKKSFDSEKFSHAYLFIGPEQTGKKTLALEFANLILKSDVQKRAHPDFILINPQEGEIQIDRIRELTARVSLKPFFASFKVAVIDQAHLLNQQAQNCFLKTLEEPKGDSVLILITEFPQMLLPTIVSRCEMIRFHSVPREEIEKYLIDQNISAPEIEEIAPFFLGKPGRAVDFFSDSAKLKNQKKFIQDLNKMVKSNLAERFSFAKDLAEKSGDLKEVLDGWLSYLREILISKIKSPAGTKTDSQNSFSQHSLTKITETIRFIQDLNFQLMKTNVNNKLALEVLMLKL